MSTPSKEKALRVIRGFYPIVDISYTPECNSYRLAEDILASGATLLQYRQKNLDEEEFKKTAQELAYLRVHNPFFFIINHFVDVALQLGADGVHLGSGSISVKEARKILGGQAVIGVSVHSLDEGMRQEEEGADYLFFGSIYPSVTKGKDHPVQGIEKLSEIVHAVSIPVVAIGGITLNRIQEVAASGAKAFSAITAISQSDKPTQTAMEFQRQWMLHTNKKK